MVVKLSENGEFCLLSGVLDVMTAPLIERDSDGVRCDVVVAVVVKM